ncbi:MAG: nuclear transport factor 2 family protein [Candidatus Aureabacteria bacterium]|nr:nuclear transport factor 2 family protein [Candidatus Auribacterota bacterium]
MTKPSEQIHPNLLMMKKYEDAWLRGNSEEAESFYAGDVVLHHFGRNPLAGDYRGKAEVHGYIEKLMEVTDKAETLETIDVLVDDNYAVGIIRVRFERAGKKPLEGQRVTVFKLAGGKIHDIWVRDEDQYAVDEFFS